MSVKDFLAEIGLTLDLVNIGTGRRKLELKNHYARGMVEQFLGPKFKNYIVMLELPDGRIPSSVHGDADDLALMIPVHMQETKPEELKKLAEAVLKVLYVSRFLEAVVSVAGKEMRVKIEEVK